MSRDTPRIVFVTLSNDVGSERIVSEMGRQGAACAVLGPRGCFAGLCRDVLHRRLPSLGGIWAAAVAIPPRLERLTADWRPDAVVPLDDLSAHLLRDLATAPRTSPGLRAVLRASLGDPDHYRTVDSRSRLIDLAATLGIRTPGQRSVADLPAAAAAARELGYPVVLKREQTCGGRGVTVIADDAALALAFRSADRRARAKRLARRLVGLPTSEDPALTLQAHVPGRLTLRTVACREGRVLAGITFAADRLDPPQTGSSTVIRHVEHPEIDEAASLLVGALGCSGFVSLDFLVSPSGTTHLIELNARTVGSGHLGARFGHDIYGSWLAQRAGIRLRAPDTPALDPTRPVALFPKEMQRDPASACLSPDAPCFHDVPWDEPRVLAAYRHQLQRRHRAQIDLIDHRLALSEALVAQAGEAVPATHDGFDTVSGPTRRTVSKRASVG